MKLVYQSDFTVLSGLAGLFKLSSNLLRPLIFATINAILYSTHPPRLSDFDREAQPWWVFYARQIYSGYTCPVQPELSA